MNPAFPRLGGALERGFRWCVRLESRRGAQNDRQVRPVVVGSRLSRQRVHLKMIDLTDVFGTVPLDLIPFRWGGLAAHRVAVLVLLEAKTDLVAARRGRGRLGPCGTR